MTFAAVAATMAMLALASSGTAQIYTGAAAEQPVSLVPEQPAVAEAPLQADSDIVTQTVYGFLDFTTTIGNTVMVFSPQSAPAEGGGEQPGGGPASPPSAIETRPAAAAAEEAARPDIKPSKTRKSAETSKDGEPAVGDSAARPELATRTPAQSTLVEVRAKADDVPGVKNNLAEPEYDFLSKQPAEVVDESYKLINLRPSAKSLGSKPRASARSNKENPTGLVTKLGGTIVKDGLTTVHETSVIGTYINGKYAQVLQSSSRVLAPANANSLLENANKIRPSSSQRILKTIGPHQKIKQQQQQQLEPALPVDDEPPSHAEQPGRPGRRHPNSPARPKFRSNKIAAGEESEPSNEPAARKNRPAGSRPGYKNRSQPAATTSTESPSGGRRRSGFRPSGGNGGGGGGGGGGGAATKHLKAAKSESSAPPFVSNPAIKSKLPRTQGRWSYKTTPKPRIVIRKQAGDEEARPAAGQQAPPPPPAQQQPQPAPGAEAGPGGAAATEEAPPLPPGAQRKEGVEYDGELDGSESEDAAIVNVSVQQSEAPHADKPLPVETVNVEISTAADLPDVYFEIATVKSPYAFQVGTSRNTRYVTVTSTLRRSFASAEPSGPAAPSEPLTENILAPNTGAAYESSLPLDSSVATLPPITLEPSMATPPLEILTETFSTTQTLLKTHLLPVVAANGSTSTRLTLVQTYNIARIVTATKTLPPSELYQFVPSKTLNEFNSRLDEAGSELHLELDFGDEERGDDEDAPKRVLAPGAEAEAELDLLGRGPRPAGQPERGVAAPRQPEQAAAAAAAASAEQAQQLALLKLLQGQAAGPQVITTSRPVVSLQTLYDSHVIPLISNGQTVLSTISRAVGTVPRTSYEYGASTLLAAPPVPQLPLFPQPVAQPQLAVTSLPLVQQTLATVSDSKVLKLTFGAKTAYTTLYSTRLVPTETTTYVTSTIALPPNVPPYPGYFPPAVGYPGYPFVG
ncbi:histone acetyltransferase KAT6A [Phymastichus coffea]|uniref:histone acetyltransferase KAT6A n=1 Tax=Phymastichus coffea TaxID=108790 RepID=UPI00273B97CA|nr:histone acetyltransferase KAT6A [Phymastichus coffea]XP_058807009.1 histone acetyltransferase KAT6A [Phymastichus coffea]XP_058807010.1 histone acetyltransferase KAT6A [Phymastichus coffea]